MNAYIPPDTEDYDLWHTYYLADGPHELRLVTLDDPDPRSKGNMVCIDYAVTYRPE